VVRNDLEFVRRIVAFLDGRGIETLIFGGSAEELHGLCSERAHGDLDLLYPAEDFGLVDALVRAGELSEIRGKRFPHKRAFVVDAVAVEVFLIQRDRGGPYTVFWGDVRHDRPPAKHEVIGGLRVAAASTLTSYRRSYDQLRVRGA
jgi:hypothetical protein